MAIWYLPNQPTFEDNRLYQNVTVVVPKDYHIAYSKPRSHNSITMNHYLDDPDCIAVLDGYIRNHVSY